VEVCRRVAPDREVFVLLNFSDSKQSVALPEEMADVLQGGRTGRVDLPRYGVALLLKRVGARP
jgi:hypothetical protein